MRAAEKDGIRVQGSGFRVQTRFVLKRPESLLKFSGVRRRAEALLDGRESRFELPDLYSKACHVVWLAHRRA